MTNATGEPRAKLIGTQTDYRPFAISKQLASGRATPHTICAVCPAALWFEQGGLQCFCTTMKFRSWPMSETPVTVCDGREAAIALYNTEKAKL